jgi:glycerophosphoryl diester phosphodiesterase
MASDANRYRQSEPRIGVYPETKHPAHFAALGLAQEAAVLRALDRFDYGREGSPVFIQSFDPRNLRELRGMTHLPLVQLLELDLGDLRAIAEYADAIGISKALATADSVAAAHALDLGVHVWTFRAENEFLPGDLRVGDRPGGHGNLEAEIERYLAMGIDGFFTDFPAIGVAVRNLRAAPAQHPLR